MFRIRIIDEFSAGHYLPGYKGDCSKMHGHNWKVEVSIMGEDLNEIGMLIDFRELKRSLKEIIQELDHKVLNDVITIKPTAENLAKYIYDKLKHSRPILRDSLEKVRVWENDRSWAEYEIR